MIPVRENSEVVMKFTQMYSNPLSGILHGKTHEFSTHIRSQHGLFEQDESSHAWLAPVFAHLTKSFLSQKKMSVYLSHAMATAMSFHMYICISYIYSSG